MNFERLDEGNSTDIEQWFDLHAESQRAEFPDDAEPSRRAMVAALTNPPYGQHDELWLARDGGDIVGACDVGWPLLDNLDNAWVDILVDLSHRRRGIGRALFEHAVGRARAAGRTRMMGETREPFPGRPARHWAGVAFADAMGAKRALDEIRRRQDLQTVDDTVLDALATDAVVHADGYSLRRWTERVPDDLVDGLAVLEERMSTDAPLGDLHWEREPHDAARIRGIEHDLLVRGRASYATAVVHDATGAMAGYTRIVFDRDVPYHGYQWNTIVMPEHRGHRLGLLLKVENLRWVRQEAPRLTRLDTWNANDNPHMIAINEALGYVPIEQWAEWQLDI